VDVLETDLTSQLHLDRVIWPYLNSATSQQLSRTYMVSARSGLTSHSGVLS
jgi:hypothetical protein